LKISSRLDYALSCAIVLADMYAKDMPTPVGLIAEKERIEYDYVEQLLRALKKARLVKSLRGVNGGYKLSRGPEQITAKDILLAIEKNSLQLVCERKKARRKSCVHYSDCRVRPLWLGLRSKIEGYLSDYSLGGLLELRKKEKSYKNEKYKSLS
jgi:Rrf2 family transcriptional regulator, iron-sulfur cluster assembly transcription factor